MNTFDDIHTRKYKACSNFLFNLYRFASEIYEKEKSGMSGVGFLAL